MKLTEEIATLLKEEHIDTEAAIALMLAGQLQLMEQFAETAEKTDARLKAVENHQRKYPSIVYYWHNNRRDLIMVIAAVFLIYTLIFTPWVVSDIRHALLSWAGLPADMGVSVPPG